MLSKNNLQELKAHTCVTAIGSVAALTSVAVTVWGFGFGVLLLFIL